MKQRNCQQIKLGDEFITKEVGRDELIFILAEKLQKTY